ncbi:unnamed protein product [Arctogadus glacialis]
MELSGMVGMCTSREKLSTILCLLFRLFDSMTLIVLLGYLTCECNHILYPLHSNVYFSFQQTTIMRQNGAPLSVFYNQMS